MSWHQSPLLNAARSATFITVDALSRKRVHNRNEVPGSVRAITPAWWTSILCRDHPEAEVTDAQILDASSGTHQRHRFAIEYNAAGTDADLPRSVFTKTLPSVMNRMMGGFNGTSYAEGRFLTELRPALHIECPLGYHAALDRRTYAAINVLEDLVATKQANFCDAQTAISRAQAEQMVDLLATLHAHRYKDARLQTECRWIPNFYDWFSVGSRKMRTEHYTQQALDQAADIIPATLLRDRRKLWPATVAAADVHRSGDIGLLHSDVHVGNWYQTGDGRMGLCDWQCLTRGHWSRDLAYVLSAGLTTDDRRAWEQPLLQRYLAKLASLTNTPFEWDKAWHHYRTQMLHALWMWTITLCHSPLLPAMQTDATSRAMIARISQAADDLDSINSALGGSQA